MQLLYEFQVINFLKCCNFQHLLPSIKLLQTKQSVHDNVILQALHSGFAKEMSVHSNLNHLFDFLAFEVKLVFQLYFLDLNISG